MGTTAQKFAYLSDTKAAIKQAIVSKGIAVPDGTTFREYAKKISSIQDVSSLPTQGAKTVTPTTTEQIAVASGLYTTGDIKVAGDANLVPENIATGVSIFGVQGTHSGGGGDVATLTIDAPSNHIYAYADENGSLVHETGYAKSTALTVPVPQIVMVSATGRNESCNISGDYQTIWNLSYPNGAVIWMTGDVTAIGT